MFLIGKIIPLFKTKPMPLVRVTSCKERVRPRKSLEESDGYVYTLQYDDPKKQTRYIILWDYVEDLFKGTPDCNFVSQECLDYMNAKAQKDGNKGYNAADQIHRMEKFPPRRGPAPCTNERLTPDELEAIQAFEIDGAKEFQKERGYWPPALESALPRCNSFLQKLPNTKLAQG